jgi:HEPN domain-containing protein
MREEIERWFLQAKEELDTAKISFDSAKWFAAAFWCQQSVEKALKALFLLRKKESAVTTHSLIFLGKEVGVPAEFYEFLRDLTKEYYFSRYPDAGEEVPFKSYNENEVENYLKQSEKLIRWAEQQLKK